METTFATQFLLFSHMFRSRPALLYSALRKFDRGVCVCVCECVCVFGPWGILRSIEHIFYPLNLACLSQKQAHRQPAGMLLWWYLIRQN